MKILVVDDSTFMRSMIKNILQKEGGHELFEAGSAEEAVVVFKEKRPNLTFMDIILPGKTGVDALREIKQIDSAAVVVMCTSVGGQQKIVDEAVEIGAADFVVKPFNPEDIKKVLMKFNK